MGRTRGGWALGTPFALVIAMAAASGDDATPGQAPDLLADFSRAVGIRAADLASVEGGEPVVSSLDAAADNEVAIVAIVKVGIPKEAYLERMRDIATLKRGEPVLQIGKFGQPASLDDLAGLALDPVDIDALRACRVGDCHFALTTEAIGRLNRELDPSSPDFSARAERWVKQFLLAHVRDYLDRGDAALPVYTSRRRPVDAGAQFNALLEASPTFFGFPASLKRYLREYPAERPPNVENFLYWSKEKVGPKPVVSITHVVAAPDSDGRGYLSVASKQIYASHYFEASLGLTVALDVAGSSDSMYLLYVNRSRSDALTGFLGPLKRAMVRSRSRAGAEDTLRRLKRSLEDGLANDASAEGQSRQGRGRQAS